MLELGTPMGPGFFIFFQDESYTGGGFFTSPYEGQVSDPRYLDGIYKEKPVLTEAIETDKGLVDVETKQIDELIQEPMYDIITRSQAVELDAMAGRLDRLVREKLIKEHTDRAIEQTKKEALFNKNKQVMLMLILDEE